MIVVRSAKIMLAVALTAALSVQGCGGGDYQPVEDPRGEVNGRSFEFVSTKPDGTEWTFRIRGNSLWVGFVEKEKTGELGAIQLSGKERKKLWELIDMVDVGGRKKGKPDEKNGTVIMRMREVDDDGEHDSKMVQVSRRTEDEDVIGLANYLIDLVEKHKKVSPAF
jgi:hypothetical protein